MSSNSNVAASQTKPAQQRLQGSENVRRPVQLRRPGHASRLAPAGLADRAFAAILAQATTKTDDSVAKTLLDFRPVGQRSSLLQQKAMPQRLTPQSNLLKTDNTKILDLPYADLLVPTARKHGINPELAAAVVKAESGFNPLAQSRVGAKGLMQLMDGTARSLGVTNAFDPAQNLDGGIRFLKSLLQRFNGDTRLALAAYNAGPGAVEKYNGIPPYQETRDYVSRVLGYWQSFGGGISALTDL